MAAKKKNTEGFAFLVDALEKNKDAVYADVKAAAEKKGLVVHPIMFGRAKLKLGLVKAGKGMAKTKASKGGTPKRGKAGRPVDSSSKSGQVRSLLASGMSPADIAKKVGSSVGLVYNVKSQLKSGGSQAKRGPGRPPKAGPRRGPGRPPKASAGASGLDGLGDIIAAVRSSQADLGRYRGALEKIQSVIADVLT